MSGGGKCRWRRRRARSSSPSFRAQLSIPSFFLTFIFSKPSLLHQILLQSPFRHHRASLQPRNPSTPEYTNLPSPNQAHTDASPASSLLLSSLLSSSLHVVPALLVTSNSEEFIHKSLFLLPIKIKREILHFCDPELQNSPSTFWNSPAPVLYEDIFAKELNEADTLLCTRVGVSWIIPISKERISSRAFLLHPVVARIGDRPCIGRAV